MMVENKIRGEINRLLFLHEVTECDIRWWEYACLIVFHTPIKINDTLITELSFVSPPDTEEIMAAINSSVAAKGCNVEDLVDFLTKQ